MAKAILQLFLRKCCWKICFSNKFRKIKADKEPQENEVKSIQLRYFCCSSAVWFDQMFLVLITVVDAQYMCIIQSEPGGNNAT